MKTRTEIEAKYKWNLDDVCLLSDVEKILEQYARRAPELAKFKGKLGEKSELKAYLALDKQLDELLSPALFVLGNSNSVDMADVKIQKIMQKAQTILQSTAKYSTYVLPELNKLPKGYLRSLTTDPDFADYDMFFKDIIRNSKHIVSKRIADFLTKMSQFLGSEGEMRDLLCDSELEFEPAVDSKGEKHELNEAYYGKYLRSHDENLRHTAQANLMNGYGKFNKTLACAYTAHVHNDIFHARLAKHKTVLNARLNGDDLNRKVYDTLIRQVHANLDVLHSTISARQNLLGVDKIHFWDLSAPWCDVNQNYTIDEMKDLVLKAVSPLGKEYENLVKMKYADQSIDYLPNKDKTTGAYCSYNHGSKAVIMMNFDGTFDSVDTLAHEMGHAINNELIERAQPSTKADNGIFLAEIASTVNELLLYNYMISTAKNKAEKDVYIMKILNMYMSTIFTQTLYSEFEHFAHTELENNNALTYEDYNKKYFNLAKEYYKDSVEVPDYMGYYWARIPHFYRSYYVFKYATGMTCALAIVSNIFKDKTFAERYLDFLRVGGSKLPLDALNDIGIDLTTDQPYKQAFDYARELIKQI